VSTPRRSASGKPWKKPGPKGVRRELVPLSPLEDIGTEDGPCMKRLPNERWRRFIMAMYEVRPGHGAKVKAARLAGFGCETSTTHTMFNIANRLMHDSRILEAFAEVDAKRIRGIAPRGIRALEHLIESPGHRDHARAIGMLLDRVMPSETVHHVNVKHDVTPDFRETAQIHARIAELTAKYRLPLPAPASHVVDGEFSEIKSEAAE
jgi:hypothetical protein